MDRDWEGIFRRVEEWAQEMDQFMDHVLSARHQPVPFTPSTWQPAVNVYETSDTIVLFAELAGINPDEIAVRYEPGRLTVAGRRPDPVPDCCFSVHRMEIGVGPCMFEVPLPVSVNPQDAEALYHDGWLEIRLPKADKPSPTTITLRAQPTQEKVNGD